jgi:hypothetical protein
MDRTSRGQWHLRRVAAFDVDIHVHQDGEVFEINASRDGQNVKLFGRNLETLARELARRFSVNLNRR